MIEPCGKSRNNTTVTSRGTESHTGITPSKLKNMIFKVLLPTIRRKTKTLVTTYKKNHLNKQNNAQAVHIEPLCPRAFVEGNSNYVTELINTITNHNINNIALTGGYGSGKSSILEQFKNAKQLQKRGNKIRTISFLTSRFNDEDFLDNKQYADSENKEEAEKQERHEKTIRIEPIQFEILKQLFYQVEPNKIPKLSYGRFSETPRKVQILMLLLSISTSALVIDNLLPLRTILRNVANIALLQPWRETTYIAALTTIILVLAVILYLVLDISRTKLHNIHLKGITIQKSSFDINLELKDKNFDEVFDQIVYLFKKCKYNIIIFEDIDRCNNHKIYHELRQLNINLNSRLRFNVKFIFALKESLVENLTDRVKLFDMIIPVVPFLSPSNSIDFLQSMLQAHGFDYVRVHKTVKVICRHVTDARSLIAISNTAAIMKSDLERSTDKHRQAEIVAMASIREMCATEYTKLYDRTSIIDAIFKDCQNKYLEALNALYSSCSTRTIINKGLDEFNSQLQQSNDPRLQGILSIVFKDEKYPTDNHATLLFDIAKDQCSSTPAANLEIIKEGSLSDEYPVQQFLSMLPGAERVKLLIRNGERETRESERRELLQKDIFRQVDAKDANYKKLDRLIQELIEHGHIDKNYRQYLAPFMGKTESPTLREFLLNNIQANQPNYYVEFNDTEISDIIDDLDGSELRNDALYNFSIFSYLLKRHDENTIHAIIDSDDGHLDELFNFYAAFCNEYPFEPKSIVRPDMLTKFIKDTPTLHLLSIMSSHHPELAINSVLNNPYGSTAHQGIMLAVAILCSGESTTNITNLNNANMLPDPDYSYTINSGLGYELLKLLNANEQPIRDLEPFRTNQSLINEIVNTSYFIISKNNLSQLNHEQLLQYINRDGVHLDKDELAVILSSKDVRDSIKISLVHKLDKLNLSNNDLGSWQSIRKVIERHNTTFTANEINAANSNTNIPAFIIVAMLAYSSLNKQELLEILENISHPEWNKFSMPNHRPRVGYSKSAMALILHLKDLGIVSKYKYTQNQIVASLKKEF